MRPHSILVVDDERLIRWSVRQRLEREGYRVLVADSASETRERLADDVELILLDMKLPDNSGLGLFHEIRTHRPGCRVIVMSAHWTPETESEAIAGGACRVLQKPFRLDDVAEAVHTALA